jgi:hypothetical protein
MQRRTLGFLVTLALSLFATALAAEAQQATQGHRIGWLSSGSPRPDLDPLSMPSGRVCASSAMSRARTSSLSTVGRREGTSGSTST